LTGYVEPHFFAGFSGGRKAVIPGIASAATVKGNHRPAFIADPRCRFGVTKGNPVYEDAVEAVKRRELTPDFVVNVTIDPEHRITDVVSGGLLAHTALVERVTRQGFYPIDHQYDVVVANNGGYPLDLNLYQGVKAMAIGELAARPGGTIIVVNEHREGAGQENFDRLIHSGLSPEALSAQLLSGEIDCADQWEIQVLARVLCQFRVYVVSAMTQAELGNIGLRHAPSVEEAIALARSEDSTITNVLVLPNGPLALPRLL
jgi:nickel-dependent lactate racemase